MISQGLINLIKTSEGFSEIPYKDSVGIPTIGFGFTHYPSGVAVTMNDTDISIEQAENYLEQLLIQFTNGINALAPNCNQNQKDALIDFAYNLGLGSLKSSTLLKIVLANPNDPEIANEFSKWCHAGGKVLEGLVKRRALESQLYFTPIEQA